MKNKHPREKEPRYIVWLYLVFVIVTSFFTYFYRYNYPSSPFWDEPYHIASAEKYLHGVYFMEPHPPLGKLFIALGEKILHSNTKTDTFITTDYARDFSPTFSFTGFRLFPSLFGWLTAVVFFCIFLFLTRSSALASIFSFLYIFDNAEIVHSRSAMLDSTLSFFSLLTVLFFLLLQERGKNDIYRHCVLSFFFGVAFACALGTKVVALVLALFIPALILRFLPNWKKALLFLVAAGASFTVTYVAIWQTHFTLGTRIVPELADNGYYQASPEYKQILKNRTQGELKSFPIMLEDSLRFVGHYSKGVPRLDLCKPDENGSPSYFWPFGARTINYRWEKSGENAVRYMYLVSNPVAWGLGFIGVVLSFVLLTSRILGERTEKLQHEFIFVCTFILYVSYMIAISRLTRVMYLYHYFLPLELSFILFTISFMNVRQLWKFRLSENRRLILMTLLGLSIFAAFQLYRPLSYYEPMTKKQFERLAINPLWEMSCVGCEKKSSIVIPREQN